MLHGQERKRYKKGEILRKERVERTTWKVNECGRRQFYYFRNGKQRRILEEIKILSFPTLKINAFGM